MVGKWNTCRSSVSPCMLCILSYLPPLLQLGLDASRTAPSTSTGDTGLNDLHAGTSDLGAREEEQLSDDNICLPTPEPPSHTTESGQSGQRESIEPDPLEQEPTNDDPCSAICLPSLQTTQGFINALKVASLETSGMQKEDIESL